LLIAFGLNLAPKVAVLAIILTFFAITIIPTFAFAELGIRGAVATFFFSYITADLAPIVYAITSLWLVNLVVPALAGSIAFVIPSQKSAVE
jgi:hypothetical protein